MNRKTLELVSPLRPPTDRFIAALEPILQRGWLTNDGCTVRELETRLADELTVERVLATTNGTAALDLLLRAMVPAGEIILTGFSFPATYNVVLANRDWAPRFADIDDRCGLDPGSVEALITPRTRAILAVHPYGLPANIDGLAEVAATHRLSLIFDAAPCFGARFRGQSLASFGDGAIVSLHATKVFSSVEGGLVVTDCEKVREDVRLRRNFGIANEDDVVLIGTNAKLDELRAAFALASLPELPDALSRRREIAGLYLDGLRCGLAPVDLDPLALLDAFLSDEAFEPNFAYFPLRLPAPVRDATFDRLRARGIRARKYYHQSVTHCPIYAPYIERERLPNTVAASNEMLCLPLHPGLTDEDVEWVVSATVTAITASLEDGARAAPPRRRAATAPRGE